MRQAIVFGYGVEGKPAESVREAAALHGAAFRELRDPQAVLRGLQKAPAGILIVRLGRALSDELELMQRIHRLFPEARTIALADSDNPGIAALAWEFGAAFVLARPLPWERLPQLVAAAISKEHELTHEPTDE